MTLILKQLYALIKMLNSETGQNQIAAGIAAGFILGMTPALSLQSILVFLCLFIFRIQIGMAFLAVFFFKLVAWIMDPVFDLVGSRILELDALHGLFTALYNMPIVPLTRFNNSIVLGSGVISLLLAPVVFVLAKILIAKYRATILASLQETRAWRWMRATKLYDWYCTYDKHFGA